MSSVLDESKIRKGLLKRYHRLQQERLEALEKTRIRLLDVIVSEGLVLADGTPLPEYVEEETEYLCFRCYHNLIKFWKPVSFGPPLYYCSNDDCMAGSFYEYEAKEMTRRIYRDV